METSRAIVLLRSLANGIDPETGASLEPGNLLKRPEIVIALNRGLSALTQLEQRERERPEKAGWPWPREEDTEICNELSRGMTLQQIAQLHRRTVGAVVVRLVKLGKIAPGKAAAAASR